MHGQYGNGDKLGSEKGRVTTMVERIKILHTINQGDHPSQKMQGSKSTHTQVIVNAMTSTHRIPHFHKSQGWRHLMSWISHRGANQLSDWLLHLSHISTNVSLRGGRSTSVTDVHRYLPARSKSSGAGAHGEHSFPCMMRQDGGSCQSWGVILLIHPKGCDWIDVSKGTHGGRL